MHKTVKGTKLLYYFHYFIIMWFTPKEAFWVVDLIGFLLLRTSLLQLEDHQCVTPLMRSQVEEKEELYFWHGGPLWNPDPLTPRSALAGGGQQLPNRTLHLPHTALALTGLIFYFNQWRSLSSPTLCLFSRLSTFPPPLLSLPSGRPDHTSLYRLWQIWTEVWRRDKAATLWLSLANSLMCGTDSCHGVVWGRRSENLQR